MKTLGRIVLALIAASAIAPLVIGLKIGGVRRVAEERDERTVHLSLTLTSTEAYWLEWGCAAAVVSISCFFVSSLLSDKSEGNPAGQTEIKALPPADDIIVVEVDAAPVQPNDDFTR